MAAKKETIKSETFAEYDAKLVQLKAEYEAAKKQVAEDRKNAEAEIELADVQAANRAIELMAQEAAAQIRAVEADWKTIDFEAFSLAVAELPRLAREAGAFGLEDDVFEHAKARLDAYDEKLNPPKKKRPPRKKKPAAEQEQPAEASETE